MSHPIPSAALAHHIAFLGKTGSGKSNAAKVIAEESLDAGERICIVDPTGSWWGLRLKANGKPSNYPVVIFGGLHGDVAIGGTHGAAVAEVVATSATPAVIDTRLMNVGERTRFFTDFAETLLRKNRGPLRLVIDEAHLFAPQSGGSGGKDVPRNLMLHAANNLVSLGRSAGLRIMMLSQRPAKLHKDSLTQVETLVAMRLMHNLDVDAVKVWIGEWADKDQGKEIVVSLPSLPTGDAWVWSPEIGFLDRVHFPLARTYDSGKAPTDGDAGPELKPLDLDAVNALLDKAAVDIKANDPRALKAEVARLGRELAAAQKAAPATSAPAWPDQREVVRSLTDELAETSATLERLRAGATELQRRQDAALAALQGERVEIPAPPSRKALPFAIDHSRKPGGGASPQGDQPRVVPKPSRIAGDFQPADGLVPSSCGKPLAALAGAYPAGMTESQWSMVAGYKKTGGTWNEYRRRLMRAGMIEQRGGLWYATELGAEAAGPVELPPSPGPELVRWWAPKIQAPMHVVDKLIEVYPEGYTRSELAEEIGMAVAGGSFQEYVRRLLRNSIAEERDGRVHLTDEVMGG